MSARFIAGLGLALLAVTGALSPAEEEAPLRAPSVRVPPTPVDADLLEIRNIFRFADDLALDPALGPGADGDADGVTSREAPAAPPRARLVGLVERSGRVLVALVLDGEVVLLSVGQSARGFTVISVSEEAVGVRTPEGDERALALPD